MAVQSKVTIGPRDAIAGELASRAGKDSAFRAELIRDPRGVVERELGLTLPKAVTIHVHEEQPDAFHLVLPLSPATVQEQVIRTFELGDREVEGFADKYNKYGEPEVHAVAGVRG